MGRTGEVWRLLRAGAVVGEIVVDGGDFPWLGGRFVPGEGFAELRPLFERELALLEAERFGEWEAAVDAIEAEVELVAPGGPVAEYLLHIDGERARFRWSDEPFE